MTADETDPSQDEQSAPKPSAAPEPEGSVTDRFLSELGEAEAAPVPVETEGLADILADPEIAPAEVAAGLPPVLPLV
ncbi:hypothetical protein [Microbacterium sp. 13-71-7]|jgi:hypothetical protein|uniref:hypothetical protein n=1 Tax=Microbacterium sp. 13-71-7 TaxID=1970399 RepID=UPI000BCB8666|nr:hypothetical protein [Microbacterium sp. 13-71-7]OZB86208.1 MAG: hypothetical protein B7X32_00295 [Microbacterium sp. 13-71-7]